MWEFPLLIVMIEREGWIPNPKVLSSSSSRIINLMPESVEKPQGISFNSISILIPMPTVVRVCPVLYTECRVSEARLSISRVLRLWLRQAVNNTQHTYSITDAKNSKLCCISYVKWLVNEKHYWNLTCWRGPQYFHRLRWLYTPEQTGHWPESKGRW